MEIKDIIAMILVGNQKIINVYIRDKYDLRIFVQLESF